MNTYHGFSTRVFRPFALGLMLLLAAAHNAGALTYSFFQTGYSGGATVTGSFSGTDLNADGVLSTFDGEITAYSMSFSGNATIVPFTHTLLDLAMGGLVYFIGTPLLGDDQVAPFEGLASGPSLAFPPPPGPLPTWSYATGFGPTGMTTGFGVIQDNNLPNPPVDHTANYVVVTLVPEPGTLALLALGLAAGGVARRAARAHARQF